MKGDPVEILLVEDNPGDKLLAHNREAAERNIKMKNERIIFLNQRCLLLIPESFPLSLPWRV